MIRDLYAARAWARMADGQTYGAQQVVTGDAVRAMGAEMTAYAIGKVVRQVRAAAGHVDGVSWGRHDYFLVDEEAE